ncbi:CBM96 family carbohydrate-binding protein [Sorangium sp. So ce233]|uniref:CBM96 family carbohydrate-binding protein n=1 Tax=Sorangium sp. So ce233 TaxID=3133290 RepID=UPI003F61BE88
MADDQRQGATSTTARVIADATVRGGSYASANFGDERSLAVRTADASYTRVAYVKVDVANVDPSRLVSARLRVFGRSPSATAVSLHGVSGSSWSESAITWSTRPRLGPKIADATVRNGSGAWYEWDVTAHVAAELAAGRTQVTLALSNAARTSGPASFTSSEGGANAPVLAIELAEKEAEDPGTQPQPGSPESGPPAGNPEGACAIPPEAQAEDTSTPDRVVGRGTPESCTADAFIEAVAKGGVITFDCGPDPVTITLDRTAKIVNNAGPRTVIDGGGKVTLSGGGKVRILYQNTCDEDQVWTTPRCDNQDHPRLTVQNLTFVDGNAKGAGPDEGGGAIFVRGGRFKVVNSRFFNNVCDDVGPDVGGGAIRVLDQYQDLPVYVVKSTFGGEEGLGNVCSNGAGLSSIGVSTTVINSLFSHNRAIGNGANPARPGTPGGGSGGAIYNDGNTFTLDLCGVKMTDNTANEGGGAIFFVSNDRTGTLAISDSALRRNPSHGFETQGYPGIFVLASADPQVTRSTIE